MTNTATNAGDLSRVVNHDASSEWPLVIEIVAYWRGKTGNKGRRRSFEIPADRFFGTGRYGAPMSGDELIGMVEKLRRDGPKPIAK